MTLSHCLYEPGVASRDRTYCIGVRSMNPPAAEVTGVPRAESDPKNAFPVALATPPPGLGPEPYIGPPARRVLVDAAPCAASGRPGACTPRAGLAGALRKNDDSKRVNAAPHTSATIIESSEVEPALDTADADGLELLVALATRRRMAASTEGDAPFFSDSTAAYKSPTSLSAAFFAATASRKSFSSRATACVSVTRLTVIPPPAPSTCTADAIA
mmetsp:Transcript_12827/g.34529  ORF Transcript_12827/g.34529 Transcript_12827/m.34529 type:complete len:215 (+) Transcript_12827:860-1504(+)